LMLLSLLPFELPPILKVLFTTGLTVPLSVYNLVPRLSRLFEPWLYKEC
jgi:antibiotic biosynthesis monooxygenase (ABM) superfamily enzyme